MAVAGRWMLKEAGAAAPLSNCLKCSVRLRGVSPCVASPGPASRDMWYFGLRTAHRHFGGMCWVVGGVYFSMKSNLFHRV